MAAEAAEEHRERARRAQRLADQARERAGAEREAAERSARLMREETDPVLRDLHEHAAALHLQALQHYEDAAALQHVHAEHERRAAECADVVDAAARDPGVRDPVGDRRDRAADDRDHLADARDVTADRRERRADERERLQDEREERQDDRERRYLEVTGRPVPPGQASPIAAARAVLRRMEAKLTRERSTLERADDLAGRDQATIDRESAATADRQPPPETAP
jgi:sulfite oxidase